MRWLYISDEATGLADDEFVTEYIRSAIGYNPLWNHAHERDGCIYVWCLLAVFLPIEPRWRQDTLW